MQLALSSAAAPTAGLQTLLQGASRHGLRTLELRAGDAHGISAWTGSAPEKITSLVTQLTAAGVGVVGYHESARAGGASPESQESLASLARTLGCALFVNADEALPERLRRAEQLHAAGAEVAIVVRGEAVLEEARQAARQRLAMVWDCDPHRAPIGEVASELLGEYGESVRHIRLLGGGPESVMYEGRGIGALMARLALSGFAGSVILAPSSPRFHMLWSTWLGRRAGTGCGSKVSDAASEDLILQPLARSSNER